MINYKNQAEDEYYVKKAQEGDSDALAFLFQKYHNLAFYIALKLCHCDADAEDIVQESFIEISRSIHNLQEPKYFKAWLNKVIFSKSTKLFRKNKDMLMSDHDVLVLAQNQEERRYLLPKENMKFESDREVLLRLIDQLPMKLKVTLDLMFFQQLSVKEIALALDIPEGTVKSRISTAKSQLKVLIAEYERKENVKLDFQASGLEAALVLALGSGAVSSNALPASTGFFSKIRYFFRTIPPTSLAMILAGSIAAASFSYALIGLATTDHNQGDYETADVQYHSFNPIAFQGRTLFNAREAYEALVSNAHCYVEAKELDFELKNELQLIYTALKNNGGLYYDLLKLRKFETVFE